MGPKETECEVVDKIYVLRIGSSGFSASPGSIKIEHILSE